MRKKKFRLDCKKHLDNQARLGSLKTLDFQAVLQAIEVNRVVLCEYQASLAFHSPVLFLTLTTASRAAESCLMLSKYCKTFDSLLDIYGLD